MKRYTREEIKIDCMNECGKEIPDKVLDLMMEIQALQEDAYRKGYEDGLKEGAVL